MNKPLFDSIVPFSRIFTNSEPYRAHVPTTWEVPTLAGIDYVYPKNTSKPAREIKFTVPLGPYCLAMWTGFHRSLSVLPSPEVVEFLRASMLAVRYDSISFEINQHGAVYAQYSSILGSRLIAFVDLATLPEA